MAFGEKYSILVPEGWSADVSGDGSRLDGQGPGERAMFRAHVVKTPKSVNEMLEAGQADWSARFPGYEMLDIDFVKSKSGMDGRLAYYRYANPDKDKQNYVVQVIFKGAPGEIVILLYAMTGKKDGTKDKDNPLSLEMDAIEAMYTSLQLNE